MSSLPQPIAPTRDRILSNLLGLSAAYFAADLGFPEPAPRAKLAAGNAPARRYVQAVATIGQPSMG